MAIILVTYDLNKPGQNYQKVYDYLESFTYCKDMDSVYLLDTSTSPKDIRNHLKGIVDGNDTLFVVKITKTWAAHNYSCGDWLNKSERNW